MVVHAIIIFSKKYNLKIAKILLEKMSVVCYKKKKL